MTLIERLENWGKGMRWLRSFGGRVIFSAEGNYRSPQVWFPEGPRPIPAEYGDAWEVETAWRTLSLRNMKYSIVLKGHYVWNSTPGQVRRMVIDGGYGNVRDMESALGMARSLIAEALERGQQENQGIVEKFIKNQLAVAG